MSTTIDQRVVQMQFDNRNFESNVQTTMSTLDKLKQKLNLNGASKGLENVNAAAKNVNLTGLTSAVQTVQSRFSAMEVIAVTALANITNSAVNAGKRMVSALTIDPIKTGFSEYETQINSTQTIYSNTKGKGSTLDDVNKALEELNLYADKTIYNFTEMTRNIGTFTAAGVDLNTSVNAIQGIANLAAVSGSTSQQASTAMYQLSQALASGTVKLMDWNSVVNAGMGGEMFQNALKETSRLLGTGADAAIEASGSFRESLRDGWLTSEVLTETLKKFTTTGANEYIAEYTGLTMDTIEAETKRISTAKDTKKAIEEVAESLAKQSGKSKEEIASILEFAQDAEDAATKVKTFTQLWDVMKESAQSGWSQTWKAIVGDFEEARDLLTPLADTLTGFINKMSNARNFIVENVMDFAAPWTSITEKLGKVKEVAESVTKVTDKLEYFQKVVNDVWRGDYKNSDTGRFELLEKAGYDHRVVQDLVNKGYQYKITVEDIEESHKKFGLTMESTTEETKAVTDALAGLDEETLRNAGLTEEEIRLYKDLEKGAEKYGMTVDELAKKMSETSGRDLLIEGFKNIGSAIVNVFKAIGNAWSEIFEPASVVNIYMALEKFRDWSKTLQLVDEETGELNETGQKIQRTFKGIFAIVDILTTILGGGLKIAFKVISSVLKYFGLGILDVTAYVGDAAVKFRDWVDSLFDISGLLEKVGSGVKKVKDWFKSLAELPGVQHIVDSFNKLVDGMNKLNISPLTALASGIAFVFDRISGKIKELTGFDIKGAFSSIFSNIISAIENLTGLDLSGAGENIFDGLKKGLSNGAKGIIDTIAKAASNLIDKFCEILGIHSPSTVFIALGGFIIAGLISGIKQGLISVPESFQSIFDKCIAIVQGIDWGTIISLGISVAGLVFIKKVGDALANFSAPFAGIGAILENTAELAKSFNGVMKSLSFNIKMKAIKQLAIAVGILAGIVLLFVHFCGDDYGKMWNAVAIITVLAGVLVGLAYAMSALSSASVHFEKGKFDMKGMTSNLLTIGLAVAAVAGVVVLLGKLEPAEAKDGFKRLGIIAGGMLAFVGICQLLTKGGVSENVSKIGGLMIKLAIALGLMVGVCKLLGMLSQRELERGIIFGLSFGIFMTVLAKIAKSAGNNVSKVGGLMIKVSLAMLLMVGVCKLVSKLSVGEMIKGAAFATGFGLFIKALVGILTCGKKTHVEKVGGMILAVSVSMALMVGVCKLAGMLSWGELAKGAAFAAGFGLLIIALIAILKCGNEAQIAKVSGTILAVSIAIGILAAVSMLLSLLKVESLVKGITAVSVLAIMMSIMIHSLKGANNVMGSLIVMTVAISLLAISAAALSMIPDQKMLWSAVGSISVMMLAFGTMVKSLRGMGKIPISAIVSLGIMTAVIAGLAGILIWLNKLDPTTAIATAGGLAILMSVLSGCMAAVAAVGKYLSGGLVNGIVGLTAMVIPLITFALVLSYMPNITKAKDSIIMLTQVMIAMTGLLAAVSLIGQFLGAGILSGIIGLTLMSGSMLVFAHAVQLMPDVTGAKENILTLAHAMAAMTLILAPLTLIGLGGPAALIGIGSLVALIVAMGALMAGIGWLIGECPKIQECVEVAIPLLTKLAGGMGAMIGSFVNGMLTEMSAGLPTIGENLSKFIDSASGFINGVKMVDESVIEGTKRLAAAILLMTAADFIQGLSTLMPGSGDGLSLPLLGYQLSAFMKNAGGFISGVKNVDPTVVEAAKSLAEVILILTAADLISGLANFMPGSGEFNFDTIGTRLNAFGKAMVDFSSTITEGEGIDTAAIEAASTAGLLMVELQKSLPRSGGWVQEIMGEQDLGKFSSSCLAFGTCMTEFSKHVVAAGGIDVAAIESAAKAGTLMSELQKSLPKTGGWVQEICGEQDLVNFGLSCVAFATAITNFSKTLVESGGVDVGVAENAVKAGEIMLALQDALPRSGGWIQEIAGESDLATFGASCSAFGKAITDFCANTKVDETAVTTATNAGKAMAELQKAIPEDKWFDGKVSLEDFGKKIVKFGEKMSEYSEEVTDIDSSAVSSSITSAKRLVTLVKSLTDLDTSGIKNFDVKAIGSAMKEYNKKVEDIDASVVASSVNSAKKLVSLIKSLVGIDTSGISSFNVKSIGDKMKAYSDSVSTINASAITNSISAANKLKNFINSLAGLNTSGVGSFKTAVESLGKTQVGNIEKVFTTAATNLSKVGANMIDGVTKGMKSRERSMISAATNMAKQMIANIRKTIPTFGMTGVALMTKFVSGIKSQSGKVKAAATSSLKAAVTSMRGCYSSFYSAGSYLVDGFASGISENSFKAAAKAAAMANAAEKAAKDALDINSPSKVFRKLGYSVPEGFAMGIERLGGMVKNSTVDMTNLAIDGVKSSIVRISEAINSDMDSQPTIRPVLDLSDVRTGAAAVSGLFSNGATVGLMANVNSISSMMNGRNQNGLNDDVISAINGLRSELSNLGGDRVTVNGVTYDDGSNVSNAVKSLVRGIRLEGRV